MESPH